MKRKKNTPLKKISRSKMIQNKMGVVELLLEDHKLLRKIMVKIHSAKTSALVKKKAFNELVKTIKSHVKAEEDNFLNPIMDNPKFKNHAFEGEEEHRVHEGIIKQISKIRHDEKKIKQMQIFCEILEHHLGEEEEDLFPQFKKYAARSTRKKMGQKYIIERKATNRLKTNRGAARFTEL